MDAINPCDLPPRGAKMATVNSGSGRRAEPRVRASVPRDQQGGDPTVIVVDDHVGFRAEARALLELDGLDVVGEAGTLAEALTLAARLRPEVVLLDVGLPDGDGLELVGPLREQSPGAVVVLISGRREQDYGGRVALAAADAFIEKSALGPGVIPALLERIARL
jgi:DNA-binding NarL/FixJ family response regulator